MEQRPLEYTVKIYCEGFTEWYYFEWLRTNNRFKFSMEPDIPKNSRSSYKQNLKLIDKELRKNPQERADAIFLVIDTDTLVKNKAQYAIYQEAKEKYKKQGVIFIESHPCIEIWFLYHLMDKFARTNFETYEALRPAIESVLPKYEKTARYYQKNSLFRESILKSQTTNCGEFAIIKNGIVNFLPNADKFKCIPVAQPIRDKEISVFSTQHICQTNIVLVIDFNNVYFGIFYYNLCHSIDVSLGFSRKGSYNPLNYILWKELFAAERFMFILINTLKSGLPPLS